MSRYYTRACNFYYGLKSKSYVKQNKALPLNGIKEISFNKIEIISRKSNKKISIKEINTSPKLIKKQVKKYLKALTTIQNDFAKQNF